MAMQDTRRTYKYEFIVEEDESEMGEGGPHETSIYHFKGLLKRLYRTENWMITSNRNFYHSAIDNSKNLIVPDIALFKGIFVPPEQQPYVISWDMRLPNHPCPPLVMEIASESTYRGDIDMDKKPYLYGLIGAKEYITYDPNEPRVWPRRMGGRRLIGWRYDEAGLQREIQPDARGALWSEVLERWIVPDNLYLQLYDREGRRELTDTEAGELAQRELHLQEIVRHELEQQAQEAARAKLVAEEQAKQAKIVAEKQAKSEARARRKLEKQLQAEAQARASETQAREAAEQQIADLQRQIEELRRRNPDQS